MHSDVTRIRQVLLNLLSNACKFTQGGTVRLAVTREAGGRRLGALRRLRRRDRDVARPARTAVPGFHPGFGVDGGALRRHRSGLAISRQFCRMMGGDIEVASEEGKGLDVHRASPGRRAFAFRRGATEPRDDEDDERGLTRRDSARGRRRAHRAGLMARHLRRAGSRSSKPPTAARVSRRRVRRGPT